MFGLSKGHQGKRDKNAGSGKGADQSGGSRQHAVLAAVEKRGMHITILHK